MSRDFETPSQRVPNDMCLSQDLETPKYTVVSSRKTWEVREYDQFSVVSTDMDTSFGPGSFNALAGYIFGGNKVRPSSLASFCAAHGGDA